MLTIRLQRTGTKNKPAFRIVLAESYRSASKQALEVLGHYNPISKQFGIKSEERLKHWLSKHIALSPSVHNLFVEKKLIDSKKVKAWQPKKKSPTGDEVRSNAPSTPTGQAAESAPAAETTPAPAETPVEPQA